jgi:hypothetical protein
MRVLASLVLSITLAACKSSPGIKDTRVEFWQHKVGQDLRIGMTKGQIEAWGAANHLTFSEQHFKGTLDLATFAEDVPGTKSMLLLGGCTGWHIAIYVFFDDFGYMTRNVVRAIAICV